MNISIIYFHTGLLWRAQARVQGQSFIALHSTKDCAVQLCALRAMAAQNDTQTGASLAITDGGHGTAEAYLRLPADYEHSPL